MIPKYSSNQTPNTAGRIELFPTASGPLDIKARKLAAGLVLEANRGNPAAPFIGAVVMSISDPSLMPPPSNGAEVRAWRIGRAAIMMKQRGPKQAAVVDYWFGLGGSAVNLPFPVPTE